MPDLRIKGPCCTNRGIQYPAISETPERTTAQGKSCPCKDPSLQSREGILPHRYIFQVNKDFPPGPFCQEQGFHTGSLPLPPLSAAQPRAEVKMRPPTAV